MVAQNKIECRNLVVTYAATAALKGVNLGVRSNEILGVIGPASSGKTTFLRVLNRLLDRKPEVKVSGKVTLDGEDIYQDLRPEDLRKRVGMIFALPTPLPFSIFDNIAYGPRRSGIKNKKQLEGLVEKSLKAAYLWEEVKDRLEISAFKLSGGQQQRLCIARALAVDPEVILYDEPCSGLDPISTAKVEEAMQELKHKYTQILVTNNVKQAARVSDRTAFFLMGELLELDKTEKIFTAPQDKRTEDYVSGRFG